MIVKQRAMRFEWLDLIWSLPGWVSLIERIWSKVRRQRHEPVEPPTTTVNIADHGRLHFEFSDRVTWHSTETASKPARPEEESA